MSTTTKSGADIVDWRPEDDDNWKWKYPVIEIKPVKRAA